jgi:hypothetical protein
VRGNLLIFDDDHTTVGPTFFEVHV